MINNSSIESSRSAMATICVAALLAAAMVGLVHDPDYATTSGADSVEEGRSIRERSAMEEGLEVAGKGRLLGMAGLISAGALCVLTARGPRLYCDGLTTTIALLMAWALSSYSWSTDRETSARELARLFIYLGTAAALAWKFDPRWLCYTMALALGGSASCAVTFEVVTGGFRPWVTDYRLTGSLHSNVLGVQAAVVAILAYAFAVRRHPRAIMWWTIFFVFAAIVLLTRARTAALTVAAGLVAVHMVGRSMRDCVLVAASALSLVAVGMLASGAIGRLRESDLHQIQTMGRTDQTEALTGRVPLWQYILRRTEERPLQGFGWGAFWRVDRTVDAYYALGWYPRHSHNAYLHIAVDLGLVGLAMVLVIGAWSVIRASRLAQWTGAQEYRAIAAVMSGIYVNGIAESAFAMPRDMGLFSAAAVFSLVFVHEGWEVTADRKAVAAQRQPKLHSLKPSQALTS